MKAILLVFAPLMLCAAVVAFLNEDISGGIAATFGGVLLAAAYSALNRLDRIREAIELRNQAMSGEAPVVSRPPFFDPVKATDEMRAEPKSKWFPFRR